MPKKAKTLVMGLFLALVGIACVALFTGKAQAEEDEWSWGDPFPPISGNGWGISKDGTLTVVSNAGWQDYLANGPGEWIWEYEDNFVDERVQKLVIGKNVTALSIYDPNHWNDDSMQEGEHLLSYNAGIYEPYVSVYMQDPKCMPPIIEVEEGNGVFSVENGLLINNVKKSVVLSEIDITDVVIPDGIREIEAWAFYYRNITSIVFPKTLETIGAAAFSNCDYLTKVGLPNTLTRMDTCAFAWCGSLKQVTISSGLKTIEGLVFIGCPLRNVTIPEGVQTIGFMAFDACVDLMRITLPESLTKIDNYAFSGCKELDEINLPSNLAYLGYRAFKGCESWRIIQLPNSLMTIGEEAFLGCKPILVQLPEELTVKAIPPEERGWSANLGEEALSTRLLGFDYVETLIVSGSKYSMGDFLVKDANQVVFLQKPPADWKQITTKVYSKNLYYLDRYASDWVTLDRNVWNDIGLNAITRGQVNYIIINCENLAGQGYTPTAPVDPMEEQRAEQLEEEGWNLTSKGVLTIRSNEGWLNWLHQDLGKRVEILEIGKDVTELTLYDMSETVPVDGFYRSSDISEYDKTGAPVYPYAITSYITPSQIYLHPANKSFLYGDGILINLLTSEVVLADKNVPKDVMIPEGVRSIGNGAFKSRRIQTIQLPSTLETIGAQAFEQCSLTSLVIPNSVTSVGKFAFRECRYLKNVVLSDRLQKIETGVFYKCGLVQIALPSGIHEIKADAFNQCSNLLLVKTSESLRTIGPAAFENCEKLEDIWFSDQVESIGPRAFFGCKSLKQVVLPDKLKVIGAEAFGQCTLSLLRLPPELHIYEYDWNNQAFSTGAAVNKDRNLGLVSVENIIFSGRDYSLGTPAIVNGKNVYFQSAPPANVGEWLSSKSTGNIYCSEMYQNEWKQSEVAEWIRQKVKFIRASQVDDWLNDLLRETKQPSAISASTADQQKQSTDPIILLLIAFIVIVIAAMVLLYLKPWAKKKRRKKRNKMPQLPAAAQTQIEPEEAEKPEQRE